MPLDNDTLQSILNGSYKPSDDKVVALKYGISEHTARDIRTGNYFNRSAKRREMRINLRNVKTPKRRERANCAEIAFWTKQLRHSIARSGNLIPLDENTISRIIPKIKGDIFDQTCALWKGGVSSRKRKGDLHGRIGIPTFNGARWGKGHSVLITRLVYHNFVGHLEPSDLVLHKCNTEGLCTSLHCLKKGNHKDNQDDCTAMGNRERDSLNKRQITDEMLEKIRES